MNLATSGRCELAEEVCGQVKLGEEVSRLHNVREDERELDQMIRGILQRGEPKSIPPLS